MEFYDIFEDIFQDLSKGKKSCFHLEEGLTITQSLFREYDAVTLTMAYLKFLYGMVPQKF